MSAADDTKAAARVAATFADGPDGQYSFHGSADDLAALARFLHRADPDHPYSRSIQRKIAGTLAAHSARPTEVS